MLGSAGNRSPRGQRPRNENTIMADETGSQDDADATKGTEGNNDTSSTDTDAQGGTGDAQGGTDDAAKGDVVTRAEFDNLFKRMQAADQAKAAAETKLKEIERKDQSELEKAQSDLADIKKAHEQAMADLNEKALENEFLANNKFTWHDAKDALRLLDMDGVEVKDGNVTGLADAINKLAKAKPHLLKSEKDDSGNGDGSNGSSGASGSATNGKRKGEGKDDKVNYSGRFPALKSSK